MISFLGALALLLLGYLVYGTLVEKVFGAEADRSTPCHTKEDGVDFVPMPTWKVFLIQFLNIAGAGPIFGAIMGIMYGPAAYLWIVLGCIFAGAVHDYMVGMISVRKGGASLPEIVGDELGLLMRYAMRLCSLVLLVLCGVVFVRTPADLLHTMVSASSVWFWVVLIFCYYVLATLLPIGTLIGRIYPLFGAALLIMALGLCVGIFCHPGWMPEITDPLTGNHPAGNPVFPMLFITIACGAISGFHGTQSPLMARCLMNERKGRLVFYGSMITEGVVALVWAAATIKFAGSYDAIAAMGTPGVIVKTICSSWMGTVGAVLAVLGVVAAPVTSGDTCFRSARLIAADFMHFDQRKVWHRLVLSLPMFAVAVVLMFVDFNVLWRYFGWFNQTLATIGLWTATVWLSRSGRCYWLTLMPALFMTVVCTCYILVATEGFELSMPVGISAGLGAMAVLGGAFFVWRLRKKD